MEIVVVGVDGSEPSLDALRWAASEARLRGAGLRVGYVYDYSPAWEVYGYGYTGMPGAVPEGTIESTKADAASRARDLVEELLAGLDLDGVPVDVVVRDDPAPARALVELSEDAGMLVVGSRGRGGFAGLVLGSVSQQCVQHARCPVVVIPPGAHDEPHRP